MLKHGLLPSPLPPLPCVIPIPLGWDRPGLAGIQVRTNRLLHASSLRLPSYPFHIENHNLLAFSACMRAHGLKYFPTRPVGPSDPCPTRHRPLPYNSTFRTPGLSDFSRSRAAVSPSRQGRRLVVGVSVLLIFLFSSRSVSFSPFLLLSFSFLFFSFFSSLTRVKRQDLSQRRR